MLGSIVTKKQGIWENSKGSGWIQDPHTLQPDMPTSRDGTRKPTPKIFFKGTQIYRSFHSGCFDSERPTVTSKVGFEITGFNMQRKKFASLASNVQVSRWWVQWWRKTCDVFANTSSKWVKNLSERELSKPERDVLAKNELNIAAAPSCVL